MPGLFLLALPAFLPGIRPSSDPRAVEWTWLAGLVLGAIVPTSSCSGPSRAAAQQAPSVAGQIDRSRSGRDGLPVAGRALVEPGCGVRAGAPARSNQPRWVVPAFLLCLVLAFIAVAGAFFSIDSETVHPGLGSATTVAAIALNGVQTYDPCYRGLEAYYPPDPLRQIVRLSSPFSKSEDSTPVNLVAFQEGDGGRASRAAALSSRTATLDAWKVSFQPQGGRPLERR